MRSPAIGCATAHESPRTPDRQFVCMLDAFRDTGGLARTAEVLAQLQIRHGHAREVLAQWIDQRRVICFAWQTQDWIPWFQFSRHNMEPHYQLQLVLTELNAVYDAWELGNWFASPNPRLPKQLPVEAILTDLPAVLHAARADRITLLRDPARIAAVALPGRRLCTLRPNDCGLPCGLPHGSAGP